MTRGGAAIVAVALGLGAACGAVGPPSGGSGGRGGRDTNRADASTSDARAEAHGCSPDHDDCPLGQYCDPSVLACGPGCKHDAECALDASNGARCDPATHACVECVEDSDCALGEICDRMVNACAAGCSPTHDCAAGMSCCAGSCHDLASDALHCGDCTTACARLPNAIAACVGGACAVASCSPAFADCDGDTADGCEQNTLEDGPCTCKPGATQSCYQGAPGTEGVGPCRSGTQTCDPSGTAWGPCEGQVLPQAEICANGIDEDCDGVIDDVPDIDGDGWTRCNGDCCEVAGPGCANPALVNPGAFEVIGDGVDNDCDPSTSDTAPPPACSTAIKFSGVTAMDVANAMEICQVTTANPPLANKKWGVVSAQQLLADGSTPSANNTTVIQNLQTAILTSFGTGGVVPRSGATMAGISTGRMRDRNDTGYDATVNQNPGTGFSPTPVSLPSIYALQHGGGLAPGHCGTVQCPPGSGAYDSVNVRLIIRAPTNAQSFSYDFRFFSAEYQEYQCTPFNDYYLALLHSGAIGVPTDHDISFDALHNPVSVNNGFFQICPGNGKSCGGCPNGTTPLAGTGLELNPPSGSAPTGGGTLWLTTDAPIVPGETMELELIIFDVSDNGLNSLVLLDNFRWNQAPAVVGTHT